MKYERWESKKAKQKRDRKAIDEQQQQQQLNWTKKPNNNTLGARRMSYVVVCWGCCEIFSRNERFPRSLYYCTYVCMQRYSVYKTNFVYS